MLAEQWVYDRDVIRQVSRHYKATDEGAEGGTAERGNGAAAAGAVGVDLGDQSLPSETVEAIVSTQFLMAG